jgi:hypothetical protein
MEDRTDNPAPAEDYRVTQAREALTAASIHVSGGEVDYASESVIETLTDAIEDLLTLIDERDGR